MSQRQNPLIGHHPPVSVDDVGQFAAAGEQQPEPQPEKERVARPRENQQDNQPADPCPQDDAVPPLPTRLDHLDVTVHPLKGVRPSDEKGRDDADLEQV